MRESWGGPEQSGPLIWPASLVVLCFAIALTATHRRRALLSRLCLLCAGAGIGYAGLSTIARPAQWYATTYDGAGTQAAINRLVRDAALDIKAGTAAYLLAVASILLVLGAVMPWRKRLKGSDE